MSSDGQLPLVGGTGDRITFTPGARATVGFTPRPSDRWKVGGVEPRALPAGRLDGRQMRLGNDPKAPAPVPDATHAADPTQPAEPTHHDMTVDPMGGDRLTVILTADAA